MVALAEQEVPQPENINNNDEFPLLPNLEFSTSVYPLMAGDNEEDESDVDSKLLWNMVEQQKINRTGIEEQISSFVEMLVSIGVQEEICAVKGGVTVLAPINEAFDVLINELLILQDDISLFIQNVDIIRQVMRYHIIKNNIRKIQLNEPQNTLLDDQMLLIDHNQAFGQLILRPHNSTASFGFLRPQEGYIDLFSCKAKTLIVDAVIYPQ
eukprot:TRINITY_DN6763_c0_g1_i8.p1 TRINITY_DN6763_c0_g1~~TRINITY_DN6763_c0_g1_i8.p1  ORF type:complete len:211 (+),score=30.66 TRINITY_DN6763_c0_g1_i8:727-1359(+)